MESISGITQTTLICDFTGHWSTNWEDMELIQEGNRVTGTYTYDQGHIDGYVNSEGVFVGTWSEYPTYAEPHDAGDAEFYFTENCNTFFGNWRYGTEGDWTGDWIGTKY